MTSTDFPGVYVEETGRRPPSISGVPTSIVAFLGECGRGPKLPRLVTSYADYERRFGIKGPYLHDAVRGFFENGGKKAFIRRLARLKGEAAPNTEELSRGLKALEAPACHEVALVAAPGLVDAEATGAIIDHCEATGRFAVLDGSRGDPRLLDPRAARASDNAACYAPWLKVAGRFVPPSGHVLGVFARTDTDKAVWKAPANEVVKGVSGLEYAIDDRAQDAINERGINAIRSFPSRGIRVWGSRTLSTDPERKYVPVNRLLLFLERSIERGTSWVVFEYNDARLWTLVRGQIENFLTDLWRAGAMAGVKPEQAFYVACGLGTTMTEDDIISGRLICEIGVAPLKPAEFVTIRIGQWTTRDPP